MSFRSSLYSHFGEALLCSVLAWLGTKYERNNDLKKIIDWFKSWNLQSQAYDPMSNVKCKKKKEKKKKNMCVSQLGIKTVDLWWCHST